MSRRKRTLFVCLAVALGWVLAEFVVLLWLWYDDFRFAPTNPGAGTSFVDQMPDNLQPDDRHIWSYVPNTSYTYRDTQDDATFSVTTNSDGFRDEEEADRAAAAFRFVALGDSFTFGWLVEKPDRWDEALARLIETETGVRAASINLGMWMSTFDQHALVLEEHLPTRCDAVIHLLYPSHLQTINRHRVRMEGERIVAVSDPLLHVHRGALKFGTADTTLVSKTISFPFSFCLFRFHRNLGALTAMVEHSHSVPHMTDEQIYQRESQPVFEHGYQLLDRSLRQTARHLRERGIPYVVALVPRDRQLHAQEWQGVAPIAEILHASVPQDRILEICRHIPGIEVVDLLPHMRGRYTPALYHVHDPHWRADGHQMAARVVLQRLRESAILRR